MSSAKKYKRVVYKLSGERLGQNGVPYSTDHVSSICNDIKLAAETGLQICVVIGGGNVYRGSNSLVSRDAGDKIGMLGTIANGLFVRDVLTSMNCKVKLVSSIQIDTVVDVYNTKNVNEYLEKNNVVIASGGIGHPFFTTDTCAVLRSVQLGADICIKGTSVDGVYDKDPKKYPDAKRFDQIGHQKVIEMNLKIMDQTSISIAREHNIDIGVMSIVNKKYPLLDFINGKSSYTKISTE